MAKKGEVSTAFIVSVSLAIVGFVIAGFFLWSLSQDNGQTERDLCRLSVITRATVGDFAQQSIPLQCTPDKVCISGTGRRDDCKQFAGEQNVRVINVKGKSLTEQKDIVVEESAKAMYDCWNMMGRGKLDIFGSAWEQLGLKQAKPTCVICSRVALGENVDPRIDSEVGKGVDAYIEKEVVPGTSLTYLQAFTDRQTQSYSQVDEDAFPSDDDLEISVRGDSRQVAFVFMQIKSVDIADALTNVGFAAGGIAAASFMIPGAGKAAGAIMFNPVGATVVTVASLVGIGVVSTNAYMGQATAAGYCGEFTSTAGEDEREGCSTVQGVPYAVQNVNSLCTGGLQGNL